MTMLRCARPMVVLFCVLAFGSFVLATAEAAKPEAAKKDATGAPLVHVTDADAMRVQGELRFRANCNRCHAAPQKFPPRMMGTVLRHMRVRATITEEDRRLILFYMTQ